MTLARDNTCSQKLQTFLTESQSVTLKTLADGEYFLCVEASNQYAQSKKAENNGLKLTVDTVGPGAFDFTSGNFTRTATSTVSWTPSNGSVSYTLIVDRDSNCQPPYVENRGITGQQTQLQLQTEGLYYLCLFGVDLAGNQTQASSQVYPFSL